MFFSLHLLNLGGYVLATALFSRASGFGPLFAMIEAEQGPDALAHLRRLSGFTRSNWAPSALMPFTVMNRVFNCAAVLTDDRQFGSRVGRRIALEDFGPFAEYALTGETLRELIDRATSAQTLHSSESMLDLRVVGGRALWRLRYRANAERTVEHHAQRSLMQMLAGVLRSIGARGEDIDIHIAEPYAAEARDLERRLDVKVLPRANDYELTFPSRWLDNAIPVAGLSLLLPDDVLARYRERPLPKTLAEAVLFALEAQDAPPGAGIEIAAAEIGLQPRTLQRNLRNEGLTYREIVQAVRMVRARRLLASAQMPLSEVAFRVGYTDVSNFHRAFLTSTGVTPARFRALSRVATTSTNGTASTLPGKMSSTAIQGERTHSSNGHERDTPHGADFS